jgi:low-affinity ferrous iron transport protein
LKYALKIDAEVEWRLREITDDLKPNPIFDIPAEIRSKTERSIDSFAESMGSGIGVVLSLAFTGLWIGVGPLLQFGDNWVLIIGTFTGLIGFIDGFILRNLYSREEESVGTQFRLISASDSRLLDLLNVPTPERRVAKPSMSKRFSLIIGNACGSPAASVGAVLFVIMLLIIATIMRWSETGQLLCNTPTMIIEGFLLLALIQAHNMANEERGEEFIGVLKRRLVLNSYVQTLEN